MATEQKKKKWGKVIIGGFLLMLVLAIFMPDEPTEYQQKIYDKVYADCVYQGMKNNGIRDNVEASCACMAYCTAEKDGEKTSDDEFVSIPKECQAQFLDEMVALMSKCAKKHGVDIHNRTPEDTPVIEECGENSVAEIKEKYFNTKYRTK